MDERPAAPHERERQDNQRGGGGAAAAVPRDVHCGGNPGVAADGVVHAQLGAGRAERQQGQQQGGGAVRGAGGGVDPDGGGARGGGGPQRRARQHARRPLNLADALDRTCDAVRTAVASLLPADAPDPATAARVANLRAHAAVRRLQDKVHNTRKKDSRRGHRDD
ncbi:hypothetical protein HK100_001405 [Physocladia obscura]|uniref:Uncharacterized protein n=1 Tax=Physocladia obscura TaxID=109957 RepID=A0AAD5XG70_9FUNG|nr:hypothetical protein HK100_001405 [Physocladia obscura]